ncbi:MAG: 2-oxoglutarate dehydrogenase complex dihydrolipoyllysine-residue succinyltransferase [Anaplasmataceae bacterium]|nr:2-oxoglutarate dehydrogenase complex dihydrolipoyllysine-residue succinyltransferase [Anaplasmataceae bacterium]
MVDILVPVLGESISEARISSCYVQDGMQVNKNDILFELETDKVNLEVQAIQNGMIIDIQSKVGDYVSTGDLLCRCIDGSNSGDSGKDTGKDPVKESVKEFEKKLDNKKPQLNIDIKSDVEKAEHFTGSGPSERKSSANQAEVSADIHANIPNVGNNKQSTKGEYSVKMSALKKKMGQRLKESQNTAAILTTFNEVDMSALMNLRSKYKEIFEKKHGVKIGFMSFFVKAAVMALFEIPEINAEIRGDQVIYRDYCNIGVAIGSEKGLFVPVVRNAEELSLAGIEKDILLYVKKIKDNKLGVNDMMGGTFTISNGGVYGSLMSTPIINPPQSGILGMHTIQKRPVVVNDEIVIRPMMYLALSYDHRIADGKGAVTFLKIIKDYIEDPSRLLLEI